MSILSRHQDMHPFLRCCFCIGTAIPLIFISAIICWSYYAYVVAMCIYSIPVANVAEKVVLIILYHVFLFMFIWAYIQTTITSTIRPPRQFYLTDDEWIRLNSGPATDDADPVKDKREFLLNIIKDRDLPIYTRGHNNSVRICESCHLIKPDRCHHCSTCGECLLKMDHHCPWVNNCVGFHNYKFFILFLLYGAVYCIYVGSSSIKYFIDFWANGVSKLEAFRFHVLFLFFAAWMFALSLVGLGFYHLYLSCVNQTTLESFRAPIIADQGPDKQAYNLGASDNFRQVFGDRALLWFLPIFSSRSDGFSWTIRAKPETPTNYSSINQNQNSESPGSGLTFPSSTADGSSRTNLLSDPNRDIEMGFS